MHYIYNIVCVGCGGTGSFFIKEFARFISSYKWNENNRTLNLGIIDGDNVEIGNLNRQAFVLQDIYTNKAVTMAVAIKDNFSIDNVYAYPMYLETEKQLGDIFRSVYANNPQRHYDSKQIDVLVGCVDNHRARQVMHQFFDSHSGTVFYFDSANGYGDGEVVFSGKHNKKLLGHPRGYFFPSVLTDTEPSAAEKSCTDLNEEEPQHIVTNMMAANILLSGVCELIAQNHIKFGIAFFQSFQRQMVFRPDILEEEPKAEVANGAAER